MTCYLVEAGLDFSGWRHRALQAIHAQLPPERLRWETLSAPTSSLILDAPSVDDFARDRLPDDLPEARLTMSKTFRDLLREASSCRIPDRWTVLYTALWRWSQGHREVASAADEMGARLYQMAKGVRRDRHDFIAYLRFREQDVPAPAPRFVAWYEPDHDTLEWAAEHFADRMGRTTFLIATPDRAAFWDGTALTFQATPAGTLARPPVLETRDDGEQDAARTALWLTYYRSIFNPARLNERALVQHMPIRRWRGLPEATLIPELIGTARGGAQRVGQATAVGMRDGHAIRADMVASGIHTEADADTLAQCRRCPLWKNATTVVPGEGPHPARLMIVGEQPGDQEDLAGRVFVGPAGQVLNQALEQAGIAREALYLTNAVKHFKWEPRGKRRLHKTPQQQEMLACRHWLEGEMASVAPSVIVTLGATAFSSVMARRLSLTEHLNHPIAHDNRWVVPTYHPAYALRQVDSAGRDRALDAIVTGLKRAQHLAQSTMTAEA